MLSEKQWNRVMNLLWIGNFIISAGMSMIIPFLPIYVEQLGVKSQTAAVMWAGMIFGANHLFIAIFSPLWGKLADKYGQKLALTRSGIGMGIVIGIMAFATTPFHLLLLRCVFGVFGGFGPASVSLIAVITPKERAGEALGRLQTGAVTGGLIGPFLGGIIADSIGIKHTFMITGCAILLVAAAVIFGVSEGKKASDQTKSTETQIHFFDVIKGSPLIAALYFSSFLISAGVQTIEPVLTLYVKSMGIHQHVETIGGLIFATSALGTVLTSAYLGRLGDRIGSNRILVICLLATSLLYIPQAFAGNPYLFSLLRFLNGIFMGGLIPSINALLRRSTEKEHQGMTFGLNQTAMSLGNVAGPLLGSLIDSQFGMKSIFFGTSILFALNFVWIYYGVRKSSHIQLPLEEQKAAL